MTPEALMRRAIALSHDGMRDGVGVGPFGALIAKDGVIVAEGSNRVVATNDPTAHAEVVAIRAACAALGSFNLAGCEIYTSCEPCPMCLAAIYWARLARIHYANSRADAARIGFDDDFLYREIPLPLEARAVPITRLLADEARVAFDAWEKKPDKVRY
jgi:tRNA(Arg) A34 adenosine deaminase TadA